MIVRVKLVNPATREIRQPEGDVGADLSSTVRAQIEPGETAKIPLGIAVEIPLGYAGYILPRSGLASKGIGVWSPPIDPGYRGELHAIVYNSNRMSFWVNAGDRIAQLVVMPAPVAEFEHVFELSETSRGSKGFGSSGIRPRRETGNGG
jgi:dUTP pyrophosphatase